MHRLLVISLDKLNYLFYLRNKQFNVLADAIFLPSTETYFCFIQAINSKQSQSQFTQR